MPIADPAGADEMTARWDQAKLDELLDGMSRIEFMVRFTIAEPALDTTNIGIQNLDHLRDNVAAVRLYDALGFAVKLLKRILHFLGNELEPVRITHVTSRAGP